ncbi:MAG: TraY domain-containing protein [Phenylobacterium sp.]|uniref:TraY domain-containing protein n=1 Tax=Phenylobacterium sp. TaxID=1871053 RepID=UPI001B691AE0|nr:TraY domain-containing protein [Phenylobacterium sp.]MBP7650238.1 TraY domain-containing protein [Phenylobacterium sp.]MBP7817431.1 TraY domain-containing protein [Phenylobacterium sp.]MBP9231600.1 TraY domain-containing protein [Phenylobacterium sp.]MBP9753894.1 TraY domain-containing protein [Phenylobacterium sp.]
MADGELTLKLDDETARRLKAAADAAGRSVDDYAAELISDGLGGDDDVAEDLRIAEEYDRTGVSYSVEESVAHFRQALLARVPKTS